MTTHTSPPASAGRLRAALLDLLTLVILVVLRGAANIFISSAPVDAYRLAAAVAVGSTLASLMLLILLPLIYGVPIRGLFPRSLFAVSLVQLFIPWVVLYANI